MNNYSARTKFKTRVKNRIKYKLKKARIKSVFTFEELLGIKTGDLYDKFVSQNYDPKKHNIDHIIPCSFFDLNKPMEQLMCFNYRNLQIMTRSKEEEKGKTLPRHWKQLYAGIKRAIQGKYIRKCEVFYKGKKMQEGKDYKIEHDIVIFTKRVKPKHIQINLLQNSCDVV
jgi:hypothetical protein